MAIVAAGSLALAGAAWSGCGDDNADEAQDQVNEQIDDAQKEIDEAADDAGVDADKLQDEIDEQVDEAQDQVDQAMEDAPRPRRGARHSGPAVRAIATNRLPGP
jgi:hypothetical protein